MQRNLTLIKSTSIRVQNSADLERELRTRIVRLINRNADLHSTLNAYRAGFWALSVGLLILYAVAIGALAS